MIKNLLSGDKHYFHSNFEAVNLYPALIGCAVEKYIN